MCVKLFANSQICTQMVFDAENSNLTTQFLNKKKQNQTDYRQGCSQAEPINYKVVVILVFTVWTTLRDDFIEKQRKVVNGVGKKEKIESSSTPLIV